MLERVELPDTEGFKNVSYGDEEWLLSYSRDAWGNRIVFLYDGNVEDGKSVFRMYRYVADDTDYPSFDRTFAAHFDTYVNVPSEVMMEAMLRLYGD